MKYFTPDLLVRFGSADEHVSASAHAALERAAETYQSHLRAIRPRLPDSLQQLLDQHYLHDARVLLAGQADSGNSFVIWLRLDTPPREELILNYGLVRAPKITSHAELLDGESPYIEWLHDEVDFDTKDQPTGARQSILFSNGWEIELHFDQLELIPISQPLFALGKTQSELAGKSQ
jgi:hypothetical protein